MRRIPPLAAVRVFEAAARHRNFTKAAEELGMTQAAVSYQVKLLEDRLETSLFHRSKGRVELTEIGARIAPLLAEAFDGLEQAFSIAKTDDESVLTISTSNTFATNWLAPRLGVFQMQRPGLAVRLHTSDRLVDFARDEVDIAVRGGDGTWPGLHVQFLMRMAIAPLASPEFLDRNGPVATPDDVMRLPRLSPDDIWWERWYTQMGGTNADFPRAPGIRLDSQLMEGRAAMAGHGLAILNPALWKGDVDAGRLVQPLPSVAFHRWSYWLACPEHKRSSAKVRAFRDWIRGEIAAEATGDASGIYLEPTDAKTPPLASEADCC
jgi:LysR family glycine cleavage system transcriptional activator